MKNSACSLFVFTLILVLPAFSEIKATPFDIVTPQTKVSIVYASSGSRLDSISAHLLAKDIQSVTGYLPPVFNDVLKAKGNVIIIGSIHSLLIKSLAGNSQQLQDKWECYSLKIIKKPFQGINQALLIAGSDARGTAYGVFAISEKIGVSPWYWWADVNPLPQTRLSIDIKEVVSSPPSVKYRGIFINDEDWGLQPWAAKTFEPETNDIGPKTYARIFELLLRLKANFIWPAMHPSTKAFYYYPGNKEVAADYEIVIGSSHAEPMLRNNVSEWDEKTMGRFNYIANKEKVQQYWESRVKESSKNNVIYSMGMRGVHDSPIEGAKTPQEAVPLVEQIFADQRELFKRYVNPDVTKVPQVFTAYKEVLDIYASGLKVPDDITLMWPDDNYGYIQRLSNAQEQKRKGGSGVYYHASYWGRPHDYLWLSTTHPSLIREEMTKAYAMNAKNIWVLNVGDIKPAEYNIQLFMDMAYSVDSFNNAGYSIKHLQNWVSGLFGKQQAKSITSILWKYYGLAFDRKPEYMGWSQTEPTTQINFTAYNHRSFGDQAQKRIDSYEQLQKETKAISTSISPLRKDAFYELVQYPVNGTALINKKFLYRDKAYLYAKQGRLSAVQYDTLSKHAYDDIVKETEYYNTGLLNGKWSGIMSMNPRRLPVFQQPSGILPLANTGFLWNAVPEGYETTDSTLSEEDQPGLSLPAFNRWNNLNYFIDVFLCKKDSVNLSIETSAPWIKLSQNKIRLLPAELKGQQRITVSIDWAKVPQQQWLVGSIKIKSSDRQIAIAIKANNTATAALQQYRGFIESNGYIAINAADYSRTRNMGSRYWKKVEGLGSAGKALEAMPLLSTISQNDTALVRNNASVEYDFYTLTDSAASIHIYTLPTHPLNKDFEMRYAVSVDNGALTVQNFKTVGRSEEWKQNVLSNSAARKITLPSLKPGKHKLTIYMIDPGVILDRIFVGIGEQSPFYGSLPQAKGRE
jgi:hypothetical protein